MRTPGICCSCRSQEEKEEEEVEEASSASCSDSTVVPTCAVARVGGINCAWQKVACLFDCLASPNTGQSQEHQDGISSAEHHQKGLKHPKLSGQELPIFAHCGCQCGAQKRQPL